MVRRLCERGYQVVVVDNLVTGHREAITAGEFHPLEIADREGVFNLFRQSPIAAVMHFAAYALVGESVHLPAKYYENNVADGLRFLETLRLCGSPPLVFSSSCASYGEPREIPIREDHPQHPINPYGWTKYLFEQALRDYEQAYGQRSVILRYFNAAGADHEHGLGEVHDPETHVIPLLLQVASGRREHFTLLGRDYPTPDGSCIRDFIHVSDLVDAHLLALEHLLAGGASRTYNLGSGTGFSVLETWSTACRITGKPIHLVEGSRRPGDPAILVADPQGALSELGWKPLRGDLQTIIGDAWAWEQRCLRGNPWLSHKNRG